MELATIQRLINHSSNTSGFRPDDKTTVRVCGASDILLCQAEKDGYRGRECESVYLFFATTYLPELEIYFTTWAIRSGNTGSEQQHRLEIMEWNGGLPIQMRSGEHFKEALKSVIALLVSGKWGYPLDRAQYKINPVDEFKQAFIAAGWIDPDAAVTDSEEGEYARARRIHNENQ